MPEQHYRECLREKLMDLAGELRIGRDGLAYGSALYRKLDRSIADVIRVLDEHAGEEQLSADVRRELEDKLRIMKENALPYREQKLSQGALSGGGLSSVRDAERRRITRIRFQATQDLLKIDTKIPRNPGAENGIEDPEQLEPGDEPQTNWRLKWKQNVRYLAKKQMKTCEKRLSSLEESEKLQQDEFDALMDLSSQGNVLSYKDDADLCQKYPKLRVLLEKAIRASEKLQDLSEDELAVLKMNWVSHTIDKGISAAEKAKKRKGLPFTEKDRLLAEKRQAQFAEDHLKKYESVDKLKTAGDVLQQMARFTDLKMKVISDRQYVQYPHTNSFGNVYSVKDYESLIEECRTEEEKEFYQNLRDLRELEDAGIQHIRTDKTIDEAFYRKVSESEHRTVKKELLSFSTGKPGFRGARLANSQFGATADSSHDGIYYGDESKLRMGKIGLKFHSKNKHLQLSGGLSFGTVKTSGQIGASLSNTGAVLNLSAEASAVRARIKAQASRGGVKASVGANANLGYVSAMAQAGVGNITVKDAEGEEHTEFGVAVKAGGVAAAFKGGGGGTLNLFGLKIGLKLTTYAGAAGGEFGARATVGGIGFSLGAALGIGVGLELNINWSEAGQKLKKLWRQSKLMKLINKFKKKRAAKKAETAEKTKQSEKKNEETKKEETEKEKKKKEESTLLK